MQLNHLHLSVSDVAAAAAFFVRHGRFMLLESRGDGFAVLQDEGGFLLVLMRLPGDIDPGQAYPRMFHVGFLLCDLAQVQRCHAAMKADALEVSDIECMRGALRFYCRAPGGLLVEIGHQPGQVRCPDQQAGLPEEAVGEPGRGNGGLRHEMRPHNLADREGEQRG